MAESQEGQHHVAENRGWNAQESGLKSSLHTGGYGHIKVLQRLSQKGPQPAPILIPNIHRVVQVLQAGAHTADTAALTALHFHQETLPCSSMPRSWAGTSSQTLMLSALPLDYL